MSYAIVGKFAKRAKVTQDKYEDDTDYDERPFWAESDEQSE